MKSNIKKYFLPLNHDYYYDDFNLDLSIEYSTVNPDYVVVKETISYTIICDDDDLTIDNRFKVGIKFDVANSSLTSYNLKKLTIDNDIKSSHDLKREVKGNIMWIEYHTKLKGKKSYRVKREEEKQYNFRINPIRKQLAVWIYNNCSLDIHYPKDLIIDIHDMGVLDEFKKEDKSTASFSRIKAEYKGLIYKNQGFFLHLRKK